ncbi:cytochrome P450 [Amanita rubescens]|nr:cytochrome P450 [Amanita rubescens]
MLSSVIELAPVCLAVWLVSVLYRQWTLVRGTLRDIGDVPGKGIAWIRPDSMASMVAAPWFPRPGHIGHYFGKFSVFKKYGTTCLSSVSFWSSIPVYFVSDADAFRVINNERGVFGKDVERLEGLNIYGKNIVSTTGSEWKRHRVVVRSAFNEANNSHVWAETCRIINQWFITVDSEPEQPINCLSVFMQITFLVIASAGFGARIDFNDSLDLTGAPVIDNEYTPGSAKPMYTFGSSLTTAVRGIGIRALTPLFAYPIAKYIRIPFISRMLEETTIGFGSLRTHMEDIISNARDELLSEHAEKYCEPRTDLDRNNDAGAALLKNLVRSNAKEFGSDMLTDDEIVSDTFVFLLAGHETTARVLCFMVCLLALHPEAQAKVYAEACKLWPEAPLLDAPPEYKGTLPHLEYTTAAFYESMRLFSPPIRLMRTAFSDTILKTRRFTTNTDGSLDNVKAVNTPIKAGSVIMLDIHGLHYNPIHWGGDVDKFKPERFIDTETYKWPRDAFSGFSQGQRGCIGERFAVTEAVCIVANLVRRYEILVPANLESKPKVEQEKELLECVLKLSVTPKNARVRLAKRVTKRGA